ncbi:hypothetical protein EK21DRAFT_94530 [Setomelanomma holmii]|uniref:Uncharacterized protein n=1 Tax=Setomelanomma holmii TaxID=210430 RepID=A0A9P4LG32_9PLEO|nr:hypothetical protein EK21DRAFT_94530 [Setomelanomma holmii]
MPWSNLLVLSSAVEKFIKGNAALFRCNETICQSLGWFQYSWYRPTNSGCLDVHFRNLLGQTKEFEATDPRDKLFALLHIAADTCNVVHSNALLKPDYKKSLMEIILSYWAGGVVFYFSITIQAIKAISDRHAARTLAFGYQAPDYKKSASHALLSGVIPQFNNHPFKATRIAVIEDFHFLSRVTLASACPSRMFLLPMMDV